MQGTKDPLNDARGRVHQLATLCPQQVRVAFMEDAGHCPHDERPEEFNAAVLDFIRNCVMNSTGPAQDQTRQALVVQNT